jgi:hypothetical protein
MLPFPQISVTTVDEDDQRPKTRLFDRIAFCLVLCRSEDGLKVSHLPIVDPLGGGFVA